MLRNLVVRLFIRLLPSMLYAVKGEELERMNRWLAESHQGGNMSTYFRVRDYAILKQLGVKQDRETYLVLIGRRLELLQMLGEASAQSDKSLRDKEKKKKKKAS